MRQLLTIVCFIFVAACQLPAPHQPIATCKLPRQVLATKQPDEVDSKFVPGSFETELQSLLRPGTTIRTQNVGLVSSPPRVPNLLFLSGGSQKGAFGAGYLRGWSDRSRKLPVFDLVTGVSAGAIMATAAYIGDGDGAKAYFSRINHERDVLNAFAKRNAKGDFTFPSYISIARHGAAADLAPMREQLITYLSTPRVTGGPTVIDEVLVRANSGAKLRVGAVDLDSGDFVAFYLSEYVWDHRGNLDEHVIECFADAILASSSVPIAALPKFIDGRLYVDGGARNGMFGEVLWQQLFEIARSAKSTPGAGPHVYLLVNGTQDTDPDCKPYLDAKIDRDYPLMTQDEFCSSIVGNQAATPTRRPKWSLGDVGLRSVDVLINQIYRMNAYSIQQQYYAAYGSSQNFHFARIRSDLASSSYDGRSCDAWREYDKITQRPLEFYPNFMKCMIAYGEMRGRTDGW